VVDGRVDRAVLRLGVAPKMRQQRVLVVMARPVVVSHKIHSPAWSGGIMPAARRDAAICIEAYRPADCQEKHDGL
jgi:hypothetical protein